MELMTLIYTLTPIIADSSDSDAAAAAPLLLLLSGFVFYAYIYSRYRNADKRHTHESETTATIADLVSTDDFIKRKTGLTKAKMQGANHTRIEGALNQDSKGNKLLKMFDK